MNEEITKGSTVYDSNGYEVEVVSPASPGAVVRRILLDEESGEPCGYGRVHYVEQVFLKPPLVKLSSEYTSLQEKVALARRELHDETHALETAKKDKVKLLAKLRQVPVLEKLEAFIDGKITHYVTEECGFVKILTLEETKDHYADMRSPFKLLSLIGGSNGDIGWNLCEYSDGSGSRSQVHPCLSLEEAQTTARQLVQEKLTNIQLGKQGEYLNNNLIKSANDLKVTIPDEILSPYRKRERDGMVAHVASKKKELEKAEANLTALPPA